MPPQSVMLALDIFEYKLPWIPFDNYNPFDNLDNLGYLLITLDILGLLLLTGTNFSGFEK